MRVEQAVTLGGDALYESAKKIYPQRIKGRFRNIKTALLFITLGIYYFVPFLRWDRGPHAPGQAVLIDLGAKRAYLFFIEIWPQEVYYITGLLVLAAMTLFLMNAVAGRIWCGYLCPQTVWTDLFQYVERLAEGGRRDRIALDAAPWTVNKALRKSAKHAGWLFIAWWTGGAWVLYFNDAPTIVRELATGTAPLSAYGAIALLTATTYLLAGHMREQVCLYMCPWPRIQAALTDEYALNVSYRRDRGEPRLSLKRATKARAAGLEAGGCIDCKQCIAVCPSGVDIREGAQLACVQCGLCIDACDAVMARVGRPDGLIGYDTDINMVRRSKGLAPVYRLVRPRTVLYAVIIAAVGSVMLYTLATRSYAGLDVIHDRNPVFVKLSQGGVRNGFTVRILNKRPYERVFQLEATGLPPGASVEAFGASSVMGTDPAITTGPDSSREMRVVISVPPRTVLGETTPITFRIKDNVFGDMAVASDFFKMPKPEEGQIP